MARTILLYTGLTLLITAIFSCASVPKGSFGHDNSEVPDYREITNWAALPSVHDSADAVPVTVWRDEQSTSSADVFFIHPTTYTGKAGQNQWNADIHDEKLNLRTDKTAIRYQASAFNGAGKIYAPRYRQAHLYCFFTKHKNDAENAFQLAYEDVKSSFQYYLDHFNEGRPFIIATHSQGSLHGIHLIREFIDGKPLQQRFIAAYLVGWAVPADSFKEIKPCSLPEETGCFCSWRTFQEGYIPEKLHFKDTNIVVTNPVTWNESIPSSAQADQLGGVLRDFNKIYTQLVRTSIYEDLLWVNKPKFPGSAYFTTKNYHIADYNFFYADVRQNAQDRVRAFFSSR